MKAPINRRTRRTPAQKPVTRQGAVSTTDAEDAVEKFWASESPVTMTDAAEKQAPYEGPKTLLQQMREYLASVPADLPYEQLLEHADQAGWAWMIHQRRIETVPYQYVIGQGDNAQLAQGPGFLVSFAVLVGRKDDGDMEFIDEVSIVVPAQAGPISVGARRQILPSLIYTLFGRLPPAPPQQPMQRQDVELPDEDVEIDVADDVPEWQRAAEPDKTPAQRLNGGDVVNVVAKRTPDGLPLFKDLYAIEDESSIELVNAVINEVSDALPGITTAAGLTALWSNNEEAMTFVKDFGTPEQRKALQDMMARRKGHIEAGFAEPRRRN